MFQNKMYCQMFQQRSQLASCRAVFCAGFHMVFWTPHGVHMETMWCTCGNHVVFMWKSCGVLWKPSSVHLETTWCSHLKPCGIYLETTWYSLGKPHGIHMETKCFQFVSLHLGGYCISIPIILELVPCPFWGVYPSQSYNTSTGPMSFPAWLPHLHPILLPLVSCPRTGVPAGQDWGTSIPGTGYAEDCLII